MSHIDEASRVATKELLPAHLQDALALARETLSRYVSENNTTLYQQIDDRDGDWPALEAELEAKLLDLSDHLRKMGQEWRPAYRRDVDARMARMVSPPAAEHKTRYSVAGMDRNEHRLRPYELI